MTYYERVDELRDNTNFTVENYEIEYLTAELVLVDLFGEYIKGAEIISTTYGTGRVINTSGDALDQMIMEVAFQAGTKKFGILPIITGKIFFNKFADISEIGDAWDHAFDLHTDITRKFNELKTAEKLISMEAKKRAEAEKRAELKYQKAKTTALEEFDELVNQVRPLSNSDCFYYSLGWLANHVGTIQAAIPDYLQGAYEKHFGTDTKPYIYDSNKRTSGGYRYQWNIGITARLHKKGLTEAPSPINEYISEASHGAVVIAKTSFIWDLIDNYGFQFGKTQDLEKIRSCVPTDYIEFFEAGLMA